MRMTAFMRMHVGAGCWGEGVILQEAEQAYISLWRLDAVAPAAAIEVHLWVPAWHGASTAATTTTIITTTATAATVQIPRQDNPSVLTSRVSFLSLSSLASSRSTRPWLLLAVKNRTHAFVLLVLLYCVQ